MRITHSIVVMFMLASSAITSAAGVPSWRVNPITFPAIADPLNNPPLTNAVSVSLMITLTGQSQFNVAGLDLSALTSRGAIISNHPAGSYHPYTGFMVVFPGLEFDTYVTAPDRIGPLALAGRYNGPGPAEFGPDALNVAWGATPNSGSPGTFEIARITMFGVEPIGSTHVSGEVRVSNEPSAAVPVPPIPVRIPEPAMLLSASLASAGGLLRRRSCRGQP